MAPPEIQKDLIFAKAIAEKAHEIFRVQRLESQRANTKFHDTIPKAKAANIYRPEKREVQVKSKTSKEIILKADRNLFAQMILIAENQKLQMREVLRHPLGPLPWAYPLLMGR